MIHYKKGDNYITFYNLEKQLINTLKRKNVYMYV